MQAIDDVKRIRQDGFLTYYRSTRDSSSPAEQVIESVSVELHTPDDPVDKCVARIDVEWIAHFADASLAPRLNAEAGGAKMLALFPEVLSPFFEMHHGQLSPDAFVAGLLKIGAQSDADNELYVPLARTCACCSGLFAPENCKPAIADSMNNMCVFCAASQEREELGTSADAVMPSLRPG